MVMGRPSCSILRNYADVILYDVWSGVDFSFCSFFEDFRRSFSRCVYGLFDLKWKFCQNPGTYLDGGALSNQSQWRISLFGCFLDHGCRYHGGACYALAAKEYVFEERFTLRVSYDGGVKRGRKSRYTDRQIDR
mmetsp:Transcript_40027/g.63275  ORF Transcript_40027/g.63275 Transcript_40027/m.63275 type:complete len:134 (-) Transcript_40027:137-538(-)